MFPSPALQSDAINHKQLSRSLCFNFVHCVKKHNSFSAQLPGISANLNENYRLYNFQPSANISGKFLCDFWW